MRPYSRKLRTRYPRENTRLRLSMLADDDLCRLALENSRRWTMGLGRERIGTLGAPVDLFIAVQAKEWLEAMGLYYRTRSALLTSELCRLLGTDKLGVDLPAYRDVTHEVLFWWSKSDDGISLTDKEYIAENADASALITKMEKVYRHPENGAYYNAGVWDESTIAYCIEAGIDPDMAVSMTMAA